MGLGVGWVYNYLILIVALLVMDAVMAELRNNKDSTKKKNEILQRKMQENNLKMEEVQKELIEAFNE